jgi:S-formylglutathione hydrolase FrmB
MAHIAIRVARLWKLTFGLAGVLLLTACQTVAITPNPTALGALDCTTPGTVSSGSYTEAGSGEAHSFSIYLPPCYESAEASYPAIYLLPGAGGTQSTWVEAGADDAADTAILNGEVPPFILVASENTGFDPNPDYIVNELIPYIESHYRVKPERAHRAIMGGSLGGMIAYHLGLRFADRFASIGIFGSGVVQGEEDQLRAWVTALPAESKPRVFLNCGAQDTYMLERTQATVSILDELGIESKVVVSEGGHSTQYWVSNFPAYFEWVAQDW